MNYKWNYQPPTLQEREERRERKERGGEEGEKKGLENPIGVTGVLLERAQGAHARPSTPRDLAPP